MTVTDTLIYDGGEVKALDSGKVGGYLVLFGSSTKTDLSAMKDFFTPETDFGLEYAKMSPIFFDHGLDESLKKLTLGDVEFKTDSKGVWVEGVLKARQNYSAAVKEIIGKDLPSLIAEKKLGWSSGTASHLVERKKVGDAHEITKWPLGLDASLTATPAEPRTLAVPLKSWQPSSTKGVHLGERAEIGAAMSAVQHLHSRLHDATWQAMGDEKSLPKERMKKIGQAYDECKSTCMKTIGVLMGEDMAKAKGGDGEGAELKAAVRQLEADMISFDAEFFRS